jgi:ACS family hexuronate transporter-like MFS transporter
MLMAKYAGWVLQTVGDYGPIFAVAACVYGLALLVIQLITPRYAPARVH